MNNQILITEEQLNKILREEFCKFTAELSGDDLEGFMHGMMLTLILADAADNVINRLFRSEEGVTK